MLARGALSNLAGYHEQEGQTGQALEYARRLAELDPLDEEACRGLMRLLAACGKRSEALACYESYRRLLKQELDAAPDKETKALYERIRLEEGLQPEVPGRPHNLPASLSPLIGREAELAELQRRLLDPACRLITVLGPGGSGKTRLALEAARGLLENFPHGVYLIPLVPLGSTEAILPTLASTFGLRLHEKSPPLAQVLDYLRQKEILLLMDSFESLLEGVELVLDMLQHLARAQGPGYLPNTPERRIRTDLPVGRPGIPEFRKPRGCDELSSRPPFRQRGTAASSRGTG